ncbi:MAG: 3-isopropylmalate dehydrogenase [Sphingobacteriia bacterium]|nr:MAG: 3-isopropylmalate dehydrogenase [Sphingobacteriia bacterium]
MKKRIALIAGDGIGPEVTQQAVKVLEAVAERFGYAFDFQPALLGAVAIEKTGNPLPPETIEICRHADAVLFGAIGDPKYDNNPSATVRPEQGLLGLRKALGLFANIRPILSYPALGHLVPLKPALLQGVDFVVYRELTGGIYFGEKETSADGQTARDVCSYSVAEISRIAHLAFKAAQNRRKKLTLVDKANVLETSRLWRKTVQAIATEYPDVTVEYLYVDNAAMQIISQPAQFDVLLTENLFGDVLSDEASVLSGSLGLLPSASVGEQTALFEPIHGSYPQATGKDIANPLGSILSAALLLEHLGANSAAEAVREAVAWTLANGFVAKDIEPINYYGTQAIGDMVAGQITKGAASAYQVLNASTII